MYELSNFDAIQIGLASPEKIREWSHGEVTKPETINYRTQKPEKDGLFCEKIFGPTRDYECHCGKYKKGRYKGTICEKCGVEVTKKSVRRERMGHIELVAPVAHIWYFKGVPSRIAMLLDISPKDLEQVLYFSSYIVLDPGNVKEVTRKTVIKEKDYLEIMEKYSGKSQQEANDEEASMYKDDQYSEEVQESKAYKMEEPLTLGSFRVGIGAEAIQELLREIDLEKESATLREIVENSTGQKKLRALKRFEIVEAFRVSGNRPEWMILTVLPVLPPDLRPMVQLDGGRYATSDLNDLYRKVINRNNRLKRLKEQGAVDIMIRNEKRMLQEAVDALIDNSKRAKAFTGAGGRELKSLSGMLKGKQGRFRQNLLGKRVDYSGRSVIVVGPELKLYQCGLPKEMALELFKPFVVNKLIKNNICTNPKAAKRYVEMAKPQVWDLLEEVIKDHPVLLNRAPTLHRLGIQAFEPVLVEGRAIKLHPLACSAFNADFDGDQMAVHVPLSIEAQAEARILMLCTNNILKLSDGEPIVTPSQDMIIGSYYLTIIKPGDKGEGRFFSSFDEAYMAYADKEISLQSLVYIRVKGTDANGNTIQKLLHTTVGRFIFNEVLPQDLRFVDRTKKENALELEVEGILGINASIDQKQYATIVEKLGNGNADDITCDFIRGMLRRNDLTNEKIQKIAQYVKESGVKDVNENSLAVNNLRDKIHVELGQKPEQRGVGKKQLARIVDSCFKYHGATETAITLDKIKALGYKYSTIGAITTSIFDMHIPKEKAQIIHDAEQEVDKIRRLYARGLVTENERRRPIEKIWSEATDKIKDALKADRDCFNPIWMMADSGARGTMGQILQLSGMRGLMSDPTGKVIEIPVKSSFREGLSVLDYFISSHGGRKGMADTAIKTADSGYLTRRLVDVSHSIIVHEQDCGDTKGTYVTAIMDGESVLESLSHRIAGRYTIDPVVNPKTGEIIVEADTMITPTQAKEIEDVGIEGVTIRSVLSCKSKHGVCVKCYGKNMASGNPVKVGEAVGIIAAQSIGEPGTQLTMRTFHSGGVASTSDDITKGLPRVEELFEARKPKGVAVIAENDGVATISNDNRIITVTGPDGEAKEYEIPFGVKIDINNGDMVKAGDPFTPGSIDLQHMLKAKGIKGVQDYVIKEIQKTYRSTGVEINDKHIEVIIRQMLRKVRIETQGDTNMLPGTYVDIFTYEEENEKAIENGGEPATAKRALLGITKAALETESFLSAASFQETPKVLTDAAIKNKIDPLIGLKENVIVGKLIPAGTGMKCYKNITTVPAVTKENKLDNLDELFKDNF